MSETPRQSRKRKYRSDGPTPTWAKRTVDGPGVWASCVKGKEKQTVGELYDLFESLATELWPVEGKDQAGGSHVSDDEQDSVDFEALVAQELAVIKRPRTEKRFVNCQTGTPCVAFISCRPPIDPVKLIVTHAEDVRKTGAARTKYGYRRSMDHPITSLTRSRYTHRLIPVSGSCVANLPEIHSLCRRIFASFFAETDRSTETPQIHKYKIELRVRNHNTLTRMSIIEEIAKCMPENYVVDLDNPDVFVLVEVFKSVCGVSILRDYYRLHKFNVMTLANEKNAIEDFKREAGRVLGKELDKEDPTMDSMLDLMRRLPPTRVEENINSLIRICPDYADDLLGSVDQPLKVLTDRATGREYLACDYNRDGDSYRSPWSNEYDPPLEDGTTPSPKLRKLEIAANEAFDTYRELYYEGGASSVYLWELEDGGFAGVVLLKKVMDPSSPDEPSGSWDSIHVFETAERGRQAHYKLTSTVMLQLVTRRTEDAQTYAIASQEKKTSDHGSKSSGEVNLSGSMTRQTEQDWPLQDSSSHITNTGRMIEEMEIKMRNLLQEVYFGKTRDIVYDLRSVDDLDKTRKQRELQKELVGFIKR
ncbi:F-actin capping protein [Lanmaoa asiatica]|nr:F-actin capping protein [Lanmaoa asiatica]